jgi:hypothetical protein
MRVHLIEPIEDLPNSEISTVPGRVEIDPHLAQGLYFRFSVFDDCTGFLSHDTLSSERLNEQEFLFQSQLRVKAKGWEGPDKPK